MRLAHHYLLSWAELGGPHISVPMDGWWCISCSSNGARATAHVDADSQRLLHPWKYPKNQLVLPRIPGFDTKELKQGSNCKLSESQRSFRNSHSICSRERGKKVQNKKEKGQPPRLRPPPRSLSLSLTLPRCRRRRRRRYPTGGVTARPPLEPRDAGSHRAHRRRFVRPLPTTQVNPSVDLVLAFPQTRRGGSSPARVHGWDGLIRGSSRVLPNAVSLFRFISKGGGWSRIFFFYLGGVGQTLGGRGVRHVSAERVQSLWAAAKLRRAAILWPNRESLKCLLI